MRKKPNKRTGNKPSNGLIELVEKVNLVPPDFNFPKVDKLLEEIFFENTGTTAGASWILQNAHYEKEFRASFKSESDVPKGSSMGCLDAVYHTYDKIAAQLRQYPLLFEAIFNRGDDDSPVELFPYQRLVEYDHLRRDFLSIVYSLKGFQEYRFDKEKMPFPTRHCLQGTAVIFDVDEKARIDFQNGPLTGVLQGVDARRLRQCDVCQKVFWAYRLNQKWCSTTCKSAHFQRERRSNPKTRNEINEQRRANYRRKKALASLKEK